MVQQLHKNPRHLQAVTPLFTVGHMTNIKLLSTYKKRHENTHKTNYFSRNHHQKYYNLIIIYMREYKTDMWLCMYTTFITLRLIASPDPHLNIKVNLLKSVWICNMLGYTHITILKSISLKKYRSVICRDIPAPQY